MDEHEPVEDSEFVYRRIHPRFFSPASSVSVLFEAFRPNRSDVTGLSVFRARFSQPEDCFARADPSAVGGFAVARLAVAALNVFGLTVRPEIIPAGPPGHAVIPELNWSDYQRDKQRWKPILFQIAKLASADIVYPPAGA
jgi:hypothetical protein